MNTENSKGSPWLSFWPLGLVAVVALVFAFGMAQSSRSDAAPSAKPEAKAAVAPRKGQPVYAQKAPKGMKMITLAGGCFWSMEAIYKRLKGVQSAEPGYAGGTVKNPSYEQVSGGDTGHAESVNIIYDPKVITYGELAEVLLTVLDPTTLNQQGADKGTNYRSVIFYRDEEEKKIAQDTVKKVGNNGVWKAPIVTQISALDAFYPAEEYHHNYYDTHSDLGYCQVVIVPKLEKLSEHFASKMKK
jgi:peptide-methionine (S)-S-oxide reductase